DETFPIAQRLFVPQKPLDRRRQILFGKFRDPKTREVLDEGILLVMPKPHSYTTEDVVEFHLHGSPVVLERLMAVLVSLGVRPAHPGEFTYRAFLHGRLDLTQAEAVEAMVSAQGEAAQRQALRQLTGGLAAHLEPLEESLKSLYVKIEARLEFSEDGIPSLEREKFEKELGAVQAEVHRLLESYEQGKVLREGLALALVGPPNVGKSSLLNALLGTQRAIVTPMAGTTRDVVEGDIRLKGVKVRLFDTAGIREAQNVVEVEGIRRSRQVIEEADAVLWLVDAASPEESLGEIKNASLPEGRTWYLFNKMDLVKVKEPWKGTQLPSSRCLAVSTHTQQGLPQLLEKIEGMIQTPLLGEDMVLTSARHRREAQRAWDALENLKGLIKAKESYELWAEELREAALAVGRIRGRNLPATAFEDIFTKFCIGK
ncbi:MAG TPA: tRNA uridine-5-carboxymethylaminomethyl(34) synthesis GTPase MnmE, partial [bacterium]|nr:tRNA uridine-5-carboxymethylaminomethyl(34) synthesis GTPase MnmE [bacterium]